MAESLADFEAKPTSAKNGRELSLERTFRGELSQARTLHPARLARNADRKVPAARKVRANIGKLEPPLRVH